MKVYSIVLIHLITFNIMYSQENPEFVSDAPFILDSVNTYQKVTPVLIGKENNPLLQIRIDIKGINKSTSVKDIEINTEGTTDLKDIEDLKIFYTGTEAGFITNNQFDKSKYPSEVIVFTSDGYLLLSN